LPSYSGASDKTWLGAESRGSTLPESRESTGAPASTVNTDMPASEQSAAQEAEALVQELERMKQRAHEIAVRLRQLEGKPVQKPKRPNHFVCLKLSDNPTLVKKAEEVQAKVLEAQPALEALLVSPTLLHLTLFVMHLSDESDLVKAVKCITEYQEELVGPDQIHITMQGLASFGSDVLFGEIVTSGLDFLQRINHGLSVKFLEAGLLTTEEQKVIASGKFKPHVTLFKVSKGGKKAPKKILRDSWEPHAGFYFGDHVCHGLELSAMSEKDDKGFYKKIPGSDLTFSVNSHTVPVQVKLTPFVNKEGEQPSVAVSCGITVPSSPNKSEVTPKQDSSIMPLPKPKKTTNTSQTGLPPPRKKQEGKNSGGETKTKLKTKEQAPAAPPPPPEKREGGNPHGESKTKSKKEKRRQSTKNETGGKEESVLFHV